MESLHTARPPRGGGDDTLAERIAHDALQAFRMMETSRRDPEHEAAMHAARSTIFEMPHVEYLSPMCTSLPQRMDYVAARNYMCELRICVACGARFTWNQTLFRMECRATAHMRTAHTDSYETLSLYRNAHRSDAELSLASLFMLPVEVVHAMPQRPEYIVGCVRAWDDLDATSRQSRDGVACHVPMYDIYVRDIDAKFDLHANETSTHGSTGAAWDDVGFLSSSLNARGCVGSVRAQFRPAFIEAYILERAVPCA